MERRGWLEGVWASRKVWSSGGRLRVSGRVREMGGTYGFVYLPMWSFPVLSRYVRQKLLL